MRYEIFNQASADKRSTRLTTPTSESYIMKGIKVEMTEDSIKILNTKFNGDYYTEISKEEYEIFETMGWRIGCYILATRNNRRSLRSVQEKIATEPANTNRYVSLIRYRDVVIERFVDTLNLLSVETGQDVKCLLK
jgi:phenylalanyl-tRNA synthetase beta subunit